MFSIFNGQSRSLGGQQSAIFARVDVDFRQYLEFFKGAKLHVFMAICLHANEDGWAWPSYDTLGRETGYGRDTIASALSDLCDLTIEGHRVLLRFQPVGDGGKYQSNRYLIFPSAAECASYEHKQPCKENPNTDKPNAVKPNTDKPNAKHNQEKQTQPKHDGDDILERSESEVESLLLNFGISKAIAKRYSGSDIEKVKAWVAWIESNSDKIRNPQGFLVSKLRSGEDAPQKKKKERLPVEQICTAEKTELEKLWDAVQGVIKSQLSRQAYLSNFSNAKAIKLETGVLYLRVQENRFSVILERLQHVLENTAGAFVEFDKIELVAGGL